MNVGYARVSTSSQNLENQINQLKSAGCVKIFSEKKSGKNRADRKQFNIMMDFVREGDILFITNSKDKNVIYKQHEKGKSVAWLSKFFHVARNTIYIAIKDVAKTK